MYSTKCIHCHQLINLKTEEIREAINKAESEHQSHYEMHCPKCRKPVKIRVSDLKRKLPQPAPAEEATTPAEAETTESAESKQE